MNKPVINNVAEAVVDDILECLPGEIYKYYGNLPGRAPSQRAKRVSEAMGNLERGAAVELIEEIVDQAIFSIFYLIEAKFKNLNIETRFVDLDSGEESNASGILEEYRRCQIEKGVSTEHP